MPKKTQKSKHAPDSAHGDGASTGRRPSRPIRRPNRYLHSRGSSPVASTSTAMAPGDGDLGSILSSLHSMQAQIARLEQRTNPPAQAANAAPEVGTAHPPPRGGTHSSGDHAASDYGRTASDASSVAPSDSERESRLRRKAARQGHRTRGASSHARTVRRRVLHDRRRRRNHPASPDISSGEDSSSSSSSDSSDTDFEDYDRPQISFGQVTGSTVTEKLKQKIITNKFIEMAELLPDFKTTKSEEYSIQKSKDHTPRFVKARPKYDIRFGSWCEAFKIYTAVYLEKGKTRRTVLKLARSLLTYSSTITSLQRRNYDWAAYDRHFRSDRESSRESWATTKHDLLLLYRQDNNSFRSNRDNNAQPTNKKSGFKTGRQGQGSMGTKQNTTKDGNTIPYGYCLAYHTRGRRCERSECSFTHQSPCCKGKQIQHPIYAPCPSNPKRDSNARQPPNSFAKNSTANTSQP
jgi:hypothetical protein